jgi:magnesium-transporting ATPase (P-type)
VTEKKKKDYGELILLAIFALFIIAFLIDIHDLPYQAKLLTYILSPFIFIFLGYCMVQAIRSESKPKGRKKKSTFPELDEKTATRRQAIAFAMCVFLFIAIYGLGFYWGSGLMLALWFWIYKRVTLTTVVITIAAPVTLYLIFTVLIDFGLHEGVLITWLLE